MQILTWEFLWQVSPQGLLLDSNHDGLVDGIAACLVPLTPDQFTPPIWAALSNLAARLGLESPAIRLPLVCIPAEVESW